MSVASGETVSLVGANGSGKTTLMKERDGTPHSVGGVVEYQGVILGTRSAYKRAREGIGYSPEGRRIFPGLTVRENLEVASLSDSKRTQYAVDRMYGMFPALKIKDRQLGWTLSGGSNRCWPSVEH